MKVDNTSYRTIWLSTTNDRVVRIINQLALPHRLEIVDLRSVEDACFAIEEMQVRGAGLIGATAGFGMYLASLQAGNKTFDQDSFGQEVEEFPKSRSLSLEKILSSKATLRSS